MLPLLNGFGSQTGGMLSTLLSTTTHCPAFELKIGPSAMPSTVDLSHTMSPLSDHSDLE